MDKKTSIAKNKERGDLQVSNFSPKTQQVQVYKTREQHLTETLNNLAPPSSEVSEVNFEEWF